MHGRTLLSCIFLLSLRSDVILEHTQTFFFREGSRCGQRGGSEENRTLPREERGGERGEGGEGNSRRILRWNQGMLFMSHLLRGHAIIPPQKMSEYLFILKVSRDKILMLLIYYQFWFSFPWGRRLPLRPKDYLPKTWRGRRPKVGFSSPAYTSFPRFFEIFSE